MRRHAAVHHVGRRDGVGARARVRDGDARQQRQRGVVVDLALVQHAAGAVRGVLAQAHVGQDRQPGRRAADGANRALHGPCVVPGRRALLVLVVGQAEQEHAADAPRLRLGGDRGGHVGRDVALPGQRGDRAVDARTGDDEERLDEVGGGHARLAHEPPQALRAPQTAQANFGKTHTRSLDGGRVSAAAAPQIPTVRVGLPPLTTVYPPLRLTPRSPPQALLDPGPPEASCLPQPEHGLGGDRSRFDRWGHGCAVRATGDAWSRCACPR